MSKFRISRTVVVLLLVVLIMILGYIYNAFVSNKEGLSWNSSGTITKNVSGKKVKFNGGKIVTYTGIDHETCKKNCIANSKCIAISFGKLRSKSKDNTCYLYKDLEGTNREIYMNSEFLKR